MGTRLIVGAVLNSLLVLSVHAEDATGTNSRMFREWTYPDSYAIQSGASGTLPSGAAVGETGQFTSKDSIQRVVKFYAKKAGVDPAASPLELQSAAGKPTGDAGIVGIRANDDAPSVMLLRNAGEHSTAVTLLYWSPGDRQKLVVSISRGKDDSRTLIQLLLHRRE